MAGKEEEAVTAVQKDFVFISCGQFTDSEKLLGRQIADMVRKVSGLDAFFAEDVQDLNGLDDNILKALRDCVGFIAVMHPRGKITRPDGSSLTRASIWIEQEIAIATYIQRVENRQLPIIAFKHKSVGREGIRDLLHLNPIEFTDEAEVLSELRIRLGAWKSLKPSGIELQLASEGNKVQEGHTIRTLTVTLINNSSQRIAKYDGQVCLPASILKHWSTTYSLEVKSSDSSRRCFRFSETHYGPISPGETKRMMTIDYCTACAAAQHGGIGALVAEAVVDGKIWIEGREYVDDNTIKGLSIDAERRVAYG